MGFLKSGKPLCWKETKRNARDVQKKGINQFISTYNKRKSLKDYPLKWGDEVEYTLIKQDGGESKLYLYATELLEKLKQHSPDTVHLMWRPEYAEYMIEGVPIQPYCDFPIDLAKSETGILKRRTKAKKHLPDSGNVGLLTTVPRIGYPDAYYRHSRSKRRSSCAETVSQGHPRFSTMFNNVCTRREMDTTINIPVFKDTETPSPFYSPQIGSDCPESCLPDHVSFRSSDIGVCFSCFQVTLQACCLETARLLYDQLSILCPIVLALSAATPAVCGYLLDTDCRWCFLSEVMDDRTAEELGQEPLTENGRRINKSRWSSISTFLTPVGGRYNDVPLVFDEEFYQMMSDKGVDHLLAQHIAHLFIRDPVVLYEEDLTPSDDTEIMDHFENIQSSNWQSMRFKPPPPGTSIGWRVEVRTPELQLTGFENAALETFIVMMSVLLRKSKLNLLVPLSKMEENTRTACKRDAVRSSEFYFRKGEFLSCESSQSCGCRDSCSSDLTQNRPLSSNASSPQCQLPLLLKGQSSDGNRSSDLPDPKDVYTLMTVNEIMNGSDNFPGLLPLIRQYLDIYETNCPVKHVLHRHLNLIEKRASGELVTCATWIRDRIRAHSEYRNDSKVSAKVNSDLIAECLAVTEGRLRPRELLPPSECDEE